VAVSLEGAGVAPEQRFERVLVAIGRKPATQELRLEHTRVQLDAKGFIRVDGSSARPMRGSSPSAMPSAA